MMLLAKSCIVTKWLRCFGNISQSRGPRFLSRPPISTLPFSLVLFLSISLKPTLSNYPMINIPSAWILMLFSALIFCNLWRFLVAFQYQSLKSLEAKRLGCSVPRRVSLCAGVDGLAEGGVSRGRSAAREPPLWALWRWIPSSSGKGPMPERSRRLPEPPYTKARLGSGSNNASFTTSGTDWPDERHELLPCQQQQLWWLRT